MYPLVQTVTNITCQLSEIAHEQGYGVKEITRIWANLPISDNEESTYLEAAGQCIVEVSDLVDTKFHDLPRNERIAKKFNLMASLLNTKALLLRTI